jgi:MerR family transcriptional regulator, copper efflux regulator
MLVAAIVASSQGLEPMTMEKLENYLRIKEAAEYLGVAPNTLRNWGRDGKIIEHRHPVNNYRLYKKSDLDRLLRVAERPRDNR